MPDTLSVIAPFPATDDADYRAERLRSDLPKIAAEKGATLIDGETPTLRLMGPDERIPSGDGGSLHLGEHGLLAWEATVLASRTA